MKITSIAAAAIRDTSALGRTHEPSDDVEIEFMNPMASSGSRRGNTERFEPPWGEAVCVVTLDSGVWGIGLTAHAGAVIPLINDYLGPMLVGESVESIEDIAALWDVMATVTAAHIGASGVASYAISAIDLGLYDALGKHHDVPVYDLLGGPARDELTCYATGADVERCASLGFESFKIPCPWRGFTDAGFDEVLEAVDTAREIIGDDADLMIDCWAVMDVEAAIGICEALDTRKIGWVEDYINPEDWSGYHEVRKRAPHRRLAAGERWFTTQPFAQQAAAGTVDVLQPDTLWVGGATPTIRIADIATENSIDLAIHCAANDAFGQHLSYALAANCITEMYVGSATNLADSYRSTPGMATPVDGKLVPSNAPGFGIELTLPAIEAAT